MSPLQGLPSACCLCLPCVCLLPCVCVAPLPFRADDVLALFAGGSLGTLSAGVAWNAMGWTGVCLVGTAFAVAGLAVSLLFRARLNRPVR